MLLQPRSSLLYDASVAVFLYLFENPSLDRLLTTVLRSSKKIAS